MIPRDLGTLFDELADQGSRPASPSAARWTSPRTAASARRARPGRPGRGAAGWLDALGVRPGERVAIVKGNHWDYVLLCLAAARIGAVPALLSAQLEPDVQQTLLKRLDAGRCWSPTALPWPRAGTRPAAELTGLVRGRSRRRAALAGPGAVSLGRRPRRSPRRPRTGRGRRRATGHHAHVRDHRRAQARRALRHHAHAAPRRLRGARWPLLAAGADDTVASASSFAHGRVAGLDRERAVAGPGHAVVGPGRPELGRGRPLLACHRRPPSRRCPPPTCAGGRWPRRSPVTRSGGSACT